MDEYGELVFAGDSPGPVIHRTPEELGIPGMIEAPKVIVKAAVDIRAARDEAVKIQRDVEQRRKAAARPSVANSNRREEKTVANDLKDRVLANPSMTVSELEGLTGASKAQIYNWRWEARKKAGLIPETKAKKAMPIYTGLQHVTIDPKRAGTASALIGALARRDATSEVSVRLELTEGEVAVLIGKLNEAQRSAFLVAGVKAAILG
jgi:hypothetical protein